MAEEMRPWAYPHDGVPQFGASVAIIFRVVQYAFGRLVGYQHVGVVRDCRIVFRKSAGGTVFSNGAVLTGSYGMNLRPFSVIEV